MGDWTRITAVQDRATTDLATVKALLGVTGTDRDALLTRLLATAKEEADAYLSNPFVVLDEDTGLPVEPEEERAIPSAVEEGLVEYCRLRLLQVDMAAAGTAAAQAASGAGGVSSQAVGGWSVGYGAPSLNNVSGGAATAAAALRAAQEGYWRRYRVAPGY